MKKYYILEHTYQVTTLQMVSEDELQNPPPDSLRKDNWEWLETDIIAEKSEVQEPTS